MNKEHQPADDRGVIAVLIGSVSAMVSAAILLPFFIFGTNMVNFTKEGDDSGDGDLESLLWKLLWLFLASFAGGLVCSLVARYKEKFYSVITFAAILLLYILLLDGISAESLINYITLAGGCLIGWTVAMFLKKRKKK